VIQVLSQRSLIVKLLMDVNGILLERQVMMQHVVLISLWTRANQTLKFVNGKVQDSMDLPPLATVRTQMQVVISLMDVHGPTQVAVNRAVAIITRLQVASRIVSSVPGWILAQPELEDVTMVIQLRSSVTITMRLLGAHGLLPARHKAVVIPMTHENLVRPLTAASGQILDPTVLIVISTLL
jgi:hypothetical protein